MMRWVTVFLAVGAVLAAAGIFSTDARASDPWPYSGWGYIHTWKPLYPPPDSGDLSWKGWTINQQPLPDRDILLAMDVVNNKWAPSLNYALAAGGYRTFDFVVKPHNSSAADAKYARMDTQEQVTWFCDNPTFIACFNLEEYEYHSGVGRWVTTEASLVYGPTVYGYSNAKFSYVLSHEWGHGFGLAHHSACSGSVMASGLGCSGGQPTAAEIATALETVYGY